MFFPVFPPLSPIIHAEVPDSHPRYTFKDIPIERPGYNFGFFAGNAELVMGSSERRNIEGLFWAYSEEFNRFRFRGYPATFHLEFGLDFSHGFGADTSVGHYGPNDRVGFSLLPMLRWHGRPKNNTGLLVGLGFGLYFSDPSADLNSAVSTMPTMDIGLYHSTGRDEWQMFLRWRHSSNGGTKKPNDGQNAFLLGFGFRYSP